MASEDGHAGTGTKAGGITWPGSHVRRTLASLQRAGMARGHSGPVRRPDGEIA